MNKNVKRTIENYSMISLSIIIPVFNEEKTILQLLKLVKSESIPGISSDRASTATYWKRMTRRSPARRVNYSIGDVFPAYVSQVTRRA